jgi:uncharacterized membrane protein YraQ (UPF0718 family)
MTDINVILWGVLVRTAQAFIEATPTIVCGVLVAGILRYMVGAAGVRKAFGARGWRGVLRGWAFGMLLPVCSVGVIPVAREMLRCGVAGGTVLGFVLAAPLLNPISFLYGLTLSEPTVILVFTAASLVLALVMGGLWERLARSGESAHADEPLPPPGVKRLVAVAVGAAREACGPVLVFALVAVVGSGLLALLPFAALQGLMHYGDATAPVQMVGLAVPAFNSPLNGMMKIGLMFDHGNSVAAAFVLFVLGLGTSFGLVAWVATLRGARVAAKWFAAVVLATLLAGYALHAVLPKPARTEDHTHAFDEFSNPFMAGHDVGIAEAQKKILQKAEGLELIALPALAGFVLLGLLDRRLRRRFDIDAWLVKAPPAPTRVSKYDVVLPGPVVGLAAILGLVVFSVVGAFTYYPPPAQALDEVNRLRAEVGSEVPGAANPDPTRAARHRAAAIRNIELLDLAVRKLMVGVYIREYGLTPEQTKAAEDLRENLEHMRDALLAGKPGEAAAMRPAMLDQHRALSAAFAPPGGGQKNAD